MKRILSLLLILVSMLATSTLDAQFTRYIVKLKNKGGSPYSFSSPLNYLSQRAIDRRTRYGISIDSTDLPVTPAYITQIANVPNVTVLNASRWLNSVSILTTDANAITTINGFAFVQSVSGIAARIAGNNTIRNKFEPEETVMPLPPANGRPSQIMADFFNYGTSSFNEIHLHNGEFLHNIGLRGQGVHIAMLDGGFFSYNTLDAFDSVNANGQILSTWDFVSRDASVAEDNSHGMQCFSTIAANMPGLFVGKAPKASFHLFRTEDVGSEYPIEEHNWVCGAERADSAGCDVISSSLGYYDFDNASFNYTFSNMDGNTTTCSIGADLAAKKGLLVFNSAGNEGNNSWGRIVAPSDGDSVVAVGAVNTAGIPGTFTSRGPSADGRIKPNVSSVGVGAVVQSPSNTIGTNNGTSFAAPNMAGLGTCLWQGFPEFNNMKIVYALQQAGSRFSNPNDTVGYGVPDMKAAFSSLLIDYATSSATVNSCNAAINWSSKDVAAMKYEIERKAPGESVYTKIGDISPAAGDILANHSYQFNNPLVNITAGTISYRIRQVIDTASATFTALYIDTANVSISTGCFTTATNDPSAVKELVSVQPNPVTGTTVTLIIETPYAVTNMPIAVYDAKGSLVIQLKSSKNTGKAILDIPVANLAKGKYYIKVFNNRKTLGVADLIKL